MSHIHGSMSSSLYVIVRCAHVSCCATVDVVDKKLIERKAGSSGLRFLMLHSSFGRMPDYQGRTQVTITIVLVVNVER